MAYMVVPFALLIANNDISNAFSEIIRKKKSDHQKLVIVSHR